jgi:hypothetical protein
MDSDNTQDCSRATKAIADLRHRLIANRITQPVPAHQDPTASRETFLRRLIADAEMIPAESLAAAWGATAHELQQACELGDLFSVELEGCRWYLTPS